VLVAICALSLVTFVVQRQVLVRMNRNKQQKWEQMTPEEKATYQADVLAREEDGNKRLDFRFAL
jgi:hypothetical protein